MPASSGAGRPGSPADPPPPCRFMPGLGRSTQHFAIPVGFRVRRRKADRHRRTRPRPTDSAGRGPRPAPMRPDTISMSSEPGVVDASLSSKADRDQWSPCASASRHAQWAARNNASRHSLAVDGPPAAWVSAWPSSAGRSQDVGWLRGTKSDNVYYGKYWPLHGTADRLSIHRYPAFARRHSAVPAIPLRLRRSGQGTVIAAYFRTGATLPPMGRRGLLGTRRRLG